MRVLEQTIASAPGVVVLAGLFARAIHELREQDRRHVERFGSIERKLERLCDRFGEEVTGRHSVVPPARKD